MALSGSIATSIWTMDDGRRFNISCNWTASQSISNNTSTISWKLVFNALDGSGRVNCGELRLTFGSEQIHYRAGSSAVTASNGTVLASGTKVMNHNAEGKLSFTVKVEAGIYNWTINRLGSGTITLDNIPRAAKLSAAPNFNDEANPTITYSNPAGNAVTALDACISLTGAAAEIPYRSISKTGTTYTFNLTAAERETLRKNTSGNSRSVIFYVRTTIGDALYYSSLSKTLTIVNGNPVLNSSVVDSNATTIALTGNNNTLVKYYSNASCTIGATAVKSASISSRKVTNGSKSRTSDGVINAIESGSFVFTATDSRGNTSSKTVNKTLINYVKLSCNIAAGTPTADGSFNFMVSGNCFNGSFGAVSNTLDVFYRYKVAGGSYTSWQGMTTTNSGSKYTATAAITGLDYQATYTFQAYAQDKLAKVTTAEKQIKSLPVFDWDADSFAFHVPLFLDNTKQIWHKDTSGNNVLMVSVNASNQAFFGYGMYDAGLGSTYFDGNTVNIRSKNNINNTAGGTIGGNKAWTNSSDSRLKENIEDIPKVFYDIWLELAPKVFNWNELNGGDATKHFGLIAQDVITAFNKHGLDYKEYGFVSTVPVNGVEYYAITYEYYNMLTAQALRHTIAEVNTLKEELARIKGTLDNTEGDADGQ